MPLTREFKETVQARLRADRKYRKELLREGVECLLAGDLDTGKAVLRDYINATIGFEELSRRTKRPAKTLMRMLSPSGNPQARNLFEVIHHLQRAEGLHFEFHYFPLTKIHKNALTAARAAEAARLQNKFWEMHDRLYRNQKAWADLDDPRPIFVSYARELGLNISQFQADMDSNRVEQAIVADIQKAAALGINGTPTIIIDGQQLRAETTNPDGIRRGINLMLERKAAS